MVRKLALLIVTFSLALPLAHADEASKRAKLNELFTAMKLDSMMQELLASGMKQGEEIAKTMVGDKPLTPQDRKILDSFETRMQTLMSSSLAWDKLRPAYLDLYASTYSEADVDGMLAFYKSPAGQDMVTKTPALMAASQKIVLGRMQNVQTQIQQMVQDLQAQLAAAHKDASAGK